MEENKKSSRVFLLQGPNHQSKVSIFVQAIIQLLKSKYKFLVLTPSDHSKQQLLEYFLNEYDRSAYGKTIMDYDKYYDLMEYSKQSRKSELLRTQEIMKSVLVVFVKVGSCFVDKCQNQTSFRPTFAYLDNVQLDNEEIRPLYQTMWNIFATIEVPQYVKEENFKRRKWENFGFNWIEEPSDVTAYHLQYEESKDVAWWSSKLFNRYIYMPDMSIAKHSLRDLPHIDDKNRKILEDSVLYKSFVCCNTEHVMQRNHQMEFYEKMDENGSYFNEGEAEIVVSHVENLLARGLLAEEIAIHTPFDAQKRLIIKKMQSQDFDIEDIAMLFSWIKIYRKVVIFSMVRCNPLAEFQLGDSDERILHSAIIRATRQFFYVGSMWMLANSEVPGPFSSLCHAFKTVGTIVSPCMVNLGIEPTFFDITHPFGDQFLDFIGTCENVEMRNKCMKKAETLLKDQKRMQRKG